MRFSKSPQAQGRHGGTWELWPGDPQNQPPEVYPVPSCPRGGSGLAVAAANRGVARDGALGAGRAGWPGTTAVPGEGSVHADPSATLPPCSLFCRITWKMVRNLSAGLRIDTQDNVHCEPARG